MARAQADVTTIATSPQQVTGEDLCFLLVPVETYRRLEEEARRRRITVAQLLQFAVGYVLEGKDES